MGITGDLVFANKMIYFYLHASSASAPSYHIYNLRITSFLFSSSPPSISFLLYLLPAGILLAGCVFKALALRSCYVMRPGSKEWEPASWCVHMETNLNTDKSVWLKTFPSCNRKNSLPQLLGKMCFSQIQAQHLKI